MVASFRHRAIGAFAAALLIATLFSSCGNSKPTNPGDSPASMNAGKACLDSPDELPRPPEGRIPCDLIPPGLTL